MKSTSSRRWRCISKTPKSISPLPTRRSEGIRSIEDDRFDVILCDLGMDDMNGLEVGKWVGQYCRRQGISKIPFLLYTGLDKQLDEFNLKESGIDRVVNKPTPCQDLQYHHQRDGHAPQIVHLPASIYYTKATIFLAKHGTTDTAVISVSFGSEKARVASIVKGVRRQIEQDLRSDYYFVELVNQEEQSIIPEDLLSRIRHIVLYGSDRCRDLFQKECLMNYGWRESLRRADYEYFIFVDADLYSDDPSWFRQIRKRIQNDTSRIVQGFRVATDSLDPRLHYSSLAARYVLGYETDLPLNPGMCWALHRSMLEAAGGLNPLCIGGGGDSALVAEFLNTPSCQYDPWIYRNRWFREIERHLPFRARLDGVPVDVVHLHHGYLKERNYSSLHYAIEGLPPIRTLISLNHNGLLEWNDPTCAARKLLRLRPRMRSIDAVDQLFRNRATSDSSGQRLRRLAFRGAAVFP